VHPEVRDTGTQHGGNADRLIAPDACQRDPWRTLNLGGSEQHIGSRNGDRRRRAGLHADTLHRQVFGRHLRFVSQ
jgi:hypothetical protein